jgi:hypothetical protein
MIYSDIYSLADPDFTTAPIFGERRASATGSGYIRRDDPVPANLTTTRAQVSTFASFFDIDGNLHTVSADEPRISGAKVLSRNMLRNPRAEGATPGAVVLNSSAVSAAGLPTNWTLRQRSGAAGTTGAAPSLTGMTVTLHSVGIENGIDFAEITVAGTPSESCELFLLGESISGVPADINVSYTASAYVRGVSGTVPDLSFGITRQASGGLFQSGSGVPNTTPITPTTGALNTQRFSLTASTSNSNAVRIACGLRFNLTSGAAVSWRFRIGWPQIEQAASFSGNLPAVPPVGKLRSSTRYDINPGKLLVEPQRTNILTDPYTPFSTGWTNVGITGVALFTGPDGAANSAATVTEDTSTGAHNTGHVAQHAFTLGTTYTTSALVRPGTCETVQLLAASSSFSTTVFANFDLRSGTVGTKGAGVTRAEILPLANGWYWISMSAPATASGTSIPAYLLMTTSSAAARSQTYAGTSRTLDVFCVWMEVGTAATTPSLPPKIAPASATVGGDQITIPLSTMETDDDGGITHLLSVNLPVGATEQTGPQTIISFNNGTLAKSIEVVNEPARTNLIRNPRAEGAEAALVYPTFWTGGGAGTGVNGLSATVVDVGVFDGIPFVTFLIAGTATDTVGGAINFDGATGSAAVEGDVLTNSFYIMQEPGFSHSVAGLSLHARTTPVGGTDATGLAITPTESWQRVVYTRTMPASTTAAFARLRFAATVSSVISTRLRVGFPQLERGATASSIILPTAGAPASTARAANTMTLITNGQGAINLGSFTPGALTRVALGTNGMGRTIASLNYADGRVLDAAPFTSELTTVRLGSSLAGTRPALMEVSEWASVEHSFSQDAMRRL